MAKDLLEKLEALPKYDKPTEEDLVGLIRYRHTKTLGDLHKAFGGKAKETGIFEAWMGSLSDEIQHAARAYGEHICTEAIIQSMQSAQEGIIKDTADLFMLTVIKDNLAWFLLDGSISHEQGRKFIQMWASAVHGFDAHAQTWIEAFMIPEGLVHAPIARDWCKYNEHDNFGEVIKSKY